jgi:ferredoxin
MSVPVLFLPVDFAAADGLTPPDPAPGLKAAVRRLGLGGIAADAPAWALKVEPGPPGRPPLVAPGWVETVARALGAAPAGAAGPFCCDTLSITTLGLETVATHASTAAAKGFGAARGLPYLVADDPGGEAEPRPGDGPSGPAAALGRAQGLATFNPVRPHPHLGFHGAVAALGIGLSDRETKLDLHRGIRPSVDTPLCAGCGVCMTVCLFDAIVLRGGRATIDHRLCVGCGECMNVCFMAGIAPEEAAGVGRFQAAVADAAAAVNAAVPGGGRRRIHLNFLLPSARAAGGARRRRRSDGADGERTGVLVSADPVALDQATWDLLGDGQAAGLREWGGFTQDPEALLARAEDAGLGARAHALQELRI